MPLVDLPLVVYLFGIFSSGIPNILKATTVVDSKGKIGVECSQKGNQCKVEQAFPYNYYNFVHIVNYLVSFKKKM